jgi:hypothetical protein
MGAAQRRVYGMIHLPSSVAVAPDALGLSVNATVGDLTLGIHFPVAGSVDLWSMAAPEGEGSDAWTEFAAQKDWRWGHQASHQLYWVEQLGVDLLSQTGDGSEVHTTALALEDWLGRFRDWVNARTAFRMIEALRPSHDSLIHVRRPDGQGTYGGGASPLRGSMSPCPGATRIQLTDGIRRASENEGLPIAHQMLQTGWDAAIAGDLRRAVIDSGTAAEVSLASSVAAELSARGLAISASERIIQQANGVVGLVDLYESLGGNLYVSRRRVMDQLAKPRNDAAHGGQAPDKTGVENAMTVATSIVRTATPLPPPTV